MKPHERPKAALGEFCTMCNKEAAHKVSEEFLNADTNIGPFVHPMTAYICCEHYRAIFNLEGC